VEISKIVYIYTLLYTLTYFSRAKRFSAGGGGGGVFGDGYTAKN